MASPNTIKLRKELEVLRNKPTRWVWLHEKGRPGIPYRRDQKTTLRYS